MPGYVPRWASINLLVSVIAPNTRRMGFENLVRRHTALLRHQRHRHRQRVDLWHNCRILSRRPALPPLDRRVDLYPIERSIVPVPTTGIFLMLIEGVHLARSFTGRFIC